MHRYWETLIRPVCEIVGPKTIVEVGAASGLQTRKVLEFCRETGARAEIIDPVPIPASDAGGRLGCLLAEFGTVHQTTSHEALPSVTGDVYLVDGDHNWFTVFRDLLAIEESERKAGRAMPVIFAHDVGWPYGRRDMYYAPDRIPPEHRQPHARRGIAYGRSDLVSEGGLNAKRENAVKEGGERNGVLTGIEDFMAQSPVPWRLTLLPGFHGLAVLVDPSSLAREQTARLEPLLDVPAPAIAHLERVEEARLLLRTELLEAYGRLGGKPGPLLARVVRTARRWAGR